MSSWFVVVDVVLLSGVCFDVGFLVFFVLFFNLCVLGSLVILVDCVGVLLLFFAGLIFAVLVLICPFVVFFFCFVVFFL